MSCYGDIDRFGREMCNRPCKMYVLWYLRGCMSYRRYFR